jgi:hypothetical protein
MAIETTSETFKKLIGTRFVSGRCCVVACDYCKKPTRKTGGTEPGEAADIALKEGFKRVSAGLTAPMRWQCLECSEKRNKAKA